MCGNVDPRQAMNKQNLKSVTIEYGLTQSPLITSFAFTLTANQTNSQLRSNFVIKSKFIEFT